MTCSTNRHEKSVLTIQTCFKISWQKYIKLAHIIFIEKNTYCGYIEGSYL